MIYCERSLVKWFSSKVICYLYTMFFYDEHPVRIALHARGIELLKDNEVNPPNIRLVSSELIHILHQSNNVVCVSGTS